METKNVSAKHFFLCPECEVYWNIEYWSEHVFNGCGTPPAVERFVCNDCDEDYDTEEEALACSCATFEVDPNSPGYLAGAAAGARAIILDRDGNPIP